MLEAIFRYEYMQNAVFAAILGSLICGIIGTIIVEKRLVGMSGGIAHASFGGIGAGYYFSIEPILGGLLFAIISSLSVSQIQKRTDSYADTIVSMFWAAGMAIGILFISMTPGYPPDMGSYLFGDILTVNRLYLYIMAGLTLIAIFIIWSLFNYWKIYLFDEEYAKIIKLSVNKLEIILYVLIAISIVLLIKVVGIILSISMLTIPPTIAKKFTFDLKHIMILSSILGIIFSLLGLTLSYYLNIPSGASIILISIVAFFITGLKIKN